MQSKFIRRAGVLVLAVGFLSGCANSANKKDNSTEYEYIKVTGSNLRVKVKKGESYEGGTVGVGFMAAPDATGGQVEAPAGADGG